MFQTPYVANSVVVVIVVPVVIVVGISYNYDNIYNWDNIEEGAYCTCLLDYVSPFRHLCPYLLIRIHGGGEWWHLWHDGYLPDD